MANPQKKTETAAKPRRHIRFNPDPLATAEIDFSSEGSFHPEIAALIVDEAPMGGCCLIVRNHKRLTSGLCCQVKVGALAPLLARVVWITSIDPDFIKVGFEFLE